MPAMVTGQLEYVHNVRVPGMLHGRVVRPPAVGATVVRVDESSVARHARLRQGRRQEQFRRRRRREAVAGGAGGGEAEGDVDARAGACRRSATLLRSHAQAAERATRCSSIRATSTRRSRRRPRSCARPICIRIRCTDRSARSCAVADVKADSATIWSPTQGVYPLRDSCGDAARPAARAGARDLHARVRLLRHQRRRHRVVRRGAAVAGGRPARARAALAQGRDGVGELRPRVRHRPARRRSTPTATSSRGTTRPGRRRAAAGPATTRRATSVTGLLAGFQPAAFAPRSPAPAARRAARQRLERRAVVRRRLRRRRVPAAPARVQSERVLSHRRRVAVLHRPAPLAGAAAEHVRARMLHGRARGARRRPIRWSTACGTCAIRDCSAVVTAAAKAANWEARPSPRPNGRRPGVAARPRHRLRALRRRQRLLRDGRRGRASISDTGGDYASRVSSALRTAVRSRIPTACATRVEGGALHGMSRALFEEVTWDERQVTSVDWRDVPHVPGRLEGARRSRPC